jgi:hypothetical protein
MSKLVVALLANAFAFVSASALADDKTPAPVDQAKLKAERDAAEAKVGAMHGSDPYGATPVRTPQGTPLVGDFDAKDRQRAITPEEKAAAKKAKRVERQKQLEKLEAERQRKEPGWTVEDAYRQEKEFIIKKHKPTNEERQKALTEQSKKGSGQ